MLMKRAWWLILLLATLPLSGCRLEKRDVRFPLTAPPAKPAPKPTPPPVADPRLDLEATAQHIAAARGRLAANQPEDAGEEIDAALRSFAFVESNLPAALVAQGIERVNLCLGRQDLSGARRELAALRDRLRAVAPDAVALSSAVGDVRRSLRSGQTSVSTGDAEKLRGLADGPESAQQAGVIRRNLVGARDDLMRPAPKLVDLQLAEAAEGLAALGAAPSRESGPQPTPPPAPSTIQG
jgi:hypothetical protein